jgi:hypothetical protein
MKGYRSAAICILLTLALAPFAPAQQLPANSAPVPEAPPAQNTAPAPDGQASDDTVTISAPPPAPAAAPTLPTLSPVIVAEDPDVVQRFAVDPVRARDMLNRCLLKITSASDVATAWTRLGITPSDVVGIKITTAGGPLLSTHRAIVQAICDGLHAAGVPLWHIIVWDKFREDMARSQYTPVPAAEDHVGIASVFPGTGFDPDAVYKNEQIGTLIWGDSQFIQRDDDLAAAARASVGHKGFGDSGWAGDGGPTDPIEGSDGAQTSDKSYYATLVSRICTKIINVPVLTDNSYVGINGCMASLALGSVDNNRRFQGSPTFGDPAICEILSSDYIRRKVVIHILDAMVAEYAGGPVFNPIFTKSLGALYVSRDPVAIDSLVLPRLEAWRRQNRVDPIGKTASHVHDAVNYNLGTDDPGRIQRIRIQ